MRLTFVVNSVPVAQPRQRHRVIEMGDKSFVHNYTKKSDPVNAFKAAIQLALSMVYKGPVLDQAIGVYITAVFPRPKTMVYKTKPMPRIRKKTKPDNDNLEKAIWDAMSKLLYRDDCLISDSGFRKRIAAGDEKPHVVITIDTFEKE